MTLFDLIPAARASDPETSHDAARGHTASGARGANAARVLAGMEAHPGCTSRELAALIGMDRVECARRTADLRRAGLARQGEARDCTAGGKRGVTWFAITQGG